MKQCPNCELSFDKSSLEKPQHFPDEIMKELFRRQQDSDLCLDCLLEEWAAEIGEAQLKHSPAPAASADSRPKQATPLPRIL